MVVGVLRLQLYFASSGSLKEKRQSVRRICDRVRHKFNAGIAEVEGLNTWQRAGLGVVVVGNETGHVQSMLDKIAAFIEGLYLGEILDREHELLHYGEGQDFDGEGSGAMGDL